MPKTIFASHTDKFLLDFIQKSASIGTWELNTKDMILKWSEETKKLHEVPLDYKPTVGLGISFYKEGHSRETIKMLLTNCLDKKESFDSELEIITAKGKQKWVRAIGHPIIVNGVFDKIQGLFQDIDEKTKISKSLAVKEEQLRKIFEKASIGMAILDLKGNWIRVNRGLCQTFGYTSEEFKSLTFMDLTHPDDLKIGQKAIIEMLNGTKDSYETEKRYLSKSGDTIWTLLSISIVKDYKGQPQHFIAQISDITQIKESSTKVNQLLKTTENQNERLLNFAHIVSHNLNSHFSNLDMLLDIVKIDLPETTNNEIFPLIELAVTNLGQTVENLNEVASINIKKHSIIEDLNLTEYLKKSLNSIAGIIMESKTVVKNNVESHIFVKGIPAYLDSILLNLLTNAIKYRKTNEHAQINLSTCIENTNVILKIQDYGRGIDLDKHGDKLFGMYKTFHHHKDARGLGLFITKNQVEAIGGKITIKSAVDVGTTFFIHFKI